MELLLIQNTSSTNVAPPALPLSLIFFPALPRWATIGSRLRRWIEELPRCVLPLMVSERGEGLSQYEDLQDLGQIVVAIVAIRAAQVLRRDPDSLVGEQQVKGINLARAGKQGRGTRREKLHPDKPQMQLQLDGARTVAELAAGLD